MYGNSSSHMLKEYLLEEMRQSQLVATPWSDIEKKWHMRIIKTQVVKLVTSYLS
jgi:hypothetical protein